MNFEKNNIVSIFHKGNEILHHLKEEKEINFSEKVKDELAAIFNKIEDGKEIYLFFDIDGVLFEAGLETSVNKKNFEQFFLENKKQIEIFAERIKKLHESGIRIGIITGRGIEFTKKIASFYFPGGSIEKIICEGGAILISRKKEGLNIKEEETVMDSENMDFFRKNRQEIIEYAKSIGASLEKKIIIISLNAKSESNIETLFDEMKNYIEKRGIENKLEITNSVTAVDIAPKGLDKLETLREVLENNLSVYFGDAKNDEEAMKLSSLNVVLGNAMQSTKEIAKTSSLGLISKKKNIRGINDALRYITIFRFSKTKLKNKE